MTKAEQKRIEAAQFEERVRNAVARAHEAAGAAYKAFAETAKRTTDGHIADSCGGAYVVVYKPSYRLRTTLQRMGEIERGYGGAWSVSNFTKAVRDQSITANEKAANAARDVLVGEFAEAEGKFFTKSYDD